MIPQYPEAGEIIQKLLIYNHNHRMSATQALKHPYFKELREQDRVQQEGSIGGINSAAPTPS
jgi:serine/threonine protein kinase